MSYFKEFPYIQYEFPDKIERIYKNLSIRPVIIEALKTDLSDIQPYYVQNGETPETIAFDAYGDETMNWVIMLANNVMNIYEDWPMSEQQFGTYLFDKYKNQTDINGTAVVLDADQVYVFVSFKGTPAGSYSSTVLTASGSPVIIKPHHFVDDNNNYYSYDSAFNNLDAFGRSIVLPELFPVSIEEWENEKNDEKRQIYIPTEKIANKLKRELGNIVNG